LLELATHTGSRKTGGGGGGGGHFRTGKGVEGPKSYDSTETLVLYMLYSLYGMCESQSKEYGVSEYAGTAAIPASTTTGLYTDPGASSRRWLYSTVQFINVQKLQRYLFARLQLLFTVRSRLFGKGNSVKRISYSAPMNTKWWKMHYLYAA
jgi:hypothetical protein